MADNVAITPGSGANVATDDAGAGGHVQIVKLAIATDGSATVIPADADGLKVNSELAAAALLADGVALPTVPTVGAAQFRYNGATLDLERANIEGTALASAARTATTNSADITNHNARGVMVFLNVTVAGAGGGLAVRVQAKDPISAGYSSVHTAPTAITATGLTIYLIYPGATGTGVAQVVGTFLPRTFRIQVNHANADSYTYSVGYSLVV